eukprot:TRINITY_DN31162_c0_g1_i1.p1 TRINITY_DN31162_c0_g1~~TRINITY_DN31162_c0_g1_i1.p1  ORF type:complete len:814 (+),score=113.35 TRINITY_DN31162_c0_g1_i1:66-2444(+)
MLPEPRLSANLVGCSSFRKVLTPSTLATCGSLSSPPAESSLPIPPASSLSAAFPLSKSDLMQASRCWRLGEGPIAITRTQPKASRDSNRDNAYANGWMPGVATAETAVSTTTSGYPLGYTWASDESNGCDVCFDEAHVGRHVVTIPPTVGLKLGVSPTASGRRLEVRARGTSSEFPKEKLAWTVEYQPKHHIFVLTALKCIAHRLWAAQERFKRRCLLGALHEWNASSAHARLDSRLLEAELVLKNRVERAWLEANEVATAAEAHVSHISSACCSAPILANNTASAVPPGLFGNRSGIVATPSSSLCISNAASQVPPVGYGASQRRNDAADIAQDRTRTLEQHLVAVRAARRANSGAARLFRPLLRARRRLVGYSTARWKDFALPVPEAGRLAATALCRGDGAARSCGGSSDHGSPAFRWHLLGAATSEETLEDCLVRSAQERFKTRRRRDEVTQTRRAGAHLLKGTVLSCTLRATTRAFAALRHHAATHVDPPPTASCKAEVPKFGARGCSGICVSRRDDSDCVDDALHNQCTFTNLRSSRDDRESDNSVPASSSPAAIASVGKQRPQERSASERGTRSANSSVLPCFASNSTASTGIMRFGAHDQNVSDTALFAGRKGRLTWTAGIAPSALRQQSGKADSGTLTAQEAAARGRGEGSDAQSWTMDDERLRPILLADDDGSRCPAILSEPGELGVQALPSSVLGFDSSLSDVKSGRRIVDELPLQEDESQRLNEHVAEEELVSHCAQILIPAYCPPPRKLSNSATTEDIGDPNDIAAVAAMARGEDVMVTL